MTALFAAMILRQTSSPLADLPFEHEPGRIWIKATLNGKTVDAMLDTGADRTVADVSTALAVGAKKGKAFPMEGAGGDRSVPTWEIEGLALSFPGTLLSVPVRSALSMSSSKTPAGPVGRLILGMDFLRQNVVWIDYATRRVRIYDPVGFQIPSGFTKLSLLLVNGTSFTTGQLELPNSKRCDVTVAFDTGSPFGLVVTNRLVIRDGLAKRYSGQPTVQVSARPFGGRLRMKMVADVKGQIGIIPVNGVAFLVLNKGGGFGQDADVDMVAGDELLRHCDVVLDYAHNAIYLRPNGK